SHYVVIFCLKMEKRIRTVKRVGKTGVFPLAEGIGNRGVSNEPRMLGEVRFLSPSKEPRFYRSNYRLFIFFSVGAKSLSVSSIFVFFRSDSILLFEVPLVRA